MESLYDMAVIMSISKLLKCERGARDKKFGSRSKPVRYPILEDPEGSVVSLPL
jgi:hypothetical protein